MRSEYFDPIERFPERIDQLLAALNRVCMFVLLRLHVVCLFVLALYESKNKNTRNYSLEISFFNQQ